MGRGFSDLQSTILCLAYKNRIQRARSRAELAELRGQLKESRHALTAMDDIRAYHSSANAAKREERRELRRKIHDLEKDDITKRKTDLLRREVLVAHWGWRPAREGWADKRFSKVHLGEKHYNNTMQR